MSSGRAGSTPRWGGRATALLVASAAIAAGASTASAHVERPGYWPDPAPDLSVNPPAGGGVPKARNLFTALRKPPPGVTRVVCQGKVPSRKRLSRSTRSYRRARRRGASRARLKTLGRRVRAARRKYKRGVRRNASIRRVRASISKARRSGYKYRPSEATRSFSRKEARRLSRFNDRLLARCRYRSIQHAVNRSRNNDRVVVMPGLYTEPASRAAKTNDPACDKYETDGDRPNEPGALSYAYQVNCPNDQNLIAVLGREVGRGKDPNPPRMNRHGIPNLGKCIRCNFQIEGSGVTADDVIIEAGDASKGNKGPSGVGAKKDVGIRADRADGFVLRNITVRHAGEHGIYVLESDGYLLDRFKAFYNRLYGTLTFVEDHGVQQNCEAVGHGDSGIYPGAALESGVQRPVGAPFRFNQLVQTCDMHHNLAGYSGTNGNAVHVTRNNIYDNSLGIQTDVVTGAGHPGYPGDSGLFERNRIHANNFNPYAPGSDVKAAFPFPVGTGMWIAGGNHHVIRENHVFDNWRRGFMLFAVPDTLICGPQTGNTQAGCDPDRVSTSHYNQFYDNRMGMSPEGQALPNGLDFWWDGFAGNRGNCWYHNTGPRPITTDPAILPDCDEGRDPASSLGTGDPENEGELLACFVSFETGNYDPDTCPWFRSPARPGSAAASAERRQQSAAFSSTLDDFCGEIGPEATCQPFERHATAPLR